MSTTASIPVLTEWLGAGAHPVPPWLAEQRAAICAACPHNRGGSWWEKNFHEPIAIAIRRMLASKNEMSLTLSCEDKLQVCDVCGCCNRLKPWVPLNHIRVHSTKEFPAHCWITKESP